VGKSTDFLAKLVKLEQFINATSKSIVDSRMAGRELILRFIAFYIMGVDEYRFNNEMDSFLCDAMQIMNNIPPKGRHIKCYDMSIVERDFVLAMERAVKLFGDSAFRMIFRYKGKLSAKKSKINKSLFEVWSLILAKMDKDDFDKLLSNCDSLYAQLETEYETVSFRRLCNSDALLSASVKSRHMRINSIINKVLMEERV
jgi:hypothetical protein